LQDMKEKEIVLSEHETTGIVMWLTVNSNTGEITEINP